MECASALSVTVFDCATSPKGRGKELNRDRAFSRFQCAFRSLFAARQQSKPMNFGEAGIHRMFRLTQHSPREDWNVQSSFRF